MLNPGTAPAQQATDKLNKRFGEGMWAYSQQKPSPGQAQPQQSPYAASTGYGQPAFNMGNYANMPAAQRPAAFQQTMQTPFGQMDPSAFYAQRDAMVQAANNVHAQAAQNAGVFTGQSAPSLGQPTYNPQQLWQAGGAMLDQGWQNPFSQMAPNIARYAQTAESLKGAASGPRATERDQQRAAAAQRDLQEARRYAELLAADGEGSQRMQQFREDSMARQSQKTRDRYERLGLSMYPAEEEQPKAFDYGAATADWRKRNKQAVRALPPAWRATLAGLNKSLYG